MRFIETVAPREADGLVAQVYREVARDFALLRDPDGNSPFLAHSPHPQLLAAFWSVLYETALAPGVVERADKEAIAATVSRVNDCPFCVEAHALLSAVAGERRDRRVLVEGAPGEIADGPRRALVEWAAVTRQPQSELLRSPPFDREQAPEVLGTALCFHYVNRVVEVFQGHGGIRLGPAPVRGAVRALLGGFAGRAMRRKREAGRSLASAPEAELPSDLDWARSSPPVAAALARFVAAVERAGEESLPEPVRARLRSVLAAWDGEDPPLSGDWIERALEDLAPEARPAGRVALLTALAPYRLDAAAVRSFKEGRPGDRALVGAVSWAALAAARRIASWARLPEPAQA
jgi:AhpD family alkylhydroperoxidase